MGDFYLIKIDSDIILSLEQNNVTVLIIETPTLKIVPLTVIQLLFSLNVYN